MFPLCMADPGEDTCGQPLNTAGKHIFDTNDTADSIEAMAMHSLGDLYLYITGTLYPNLCLDKTLLI